MGRSGKAREEAGPRPARGKCARQKERQRHRPEAEEDSVCAAWAARELVKSGSKRAERHREGSPSPDEA